MPKISVSTTPVVVLMTVRSKSVWLNTGKLNGNAFAELFPTYELTGICAERTMVVLSVELLRVQGVDFPGKTGKVTYGDAGQK